MSASLTATIDYYSVLELAFPVHARSMRCVSNCNAHMSVLSDAYASSLNPRDPDCTMHGLPAASSTFQCVSFRPSYTNRASHISLYHEAGVRAYTYVCYRTPPHGARRRLPERGSHDGAQSQRREPRTIRGSMVGRAQSSGCVGSPLFLQSYMSSSASSTQ